MTDKKQKSNFNKKIDYLLRRVNVLYKRKPLHFFAFVTSLTVGLWLANIIVMALFFKIGEDAGPAGDMFGGVTSLFTGLAFIGLIATLVLQQKELRLQRQELKATRGEISGQKEQMELQNDQIRSQMHDTAFFQLLEVLNQHILNMRGSAIGESQFSTKKFADEVTGRPLFEHLHILTFRIAEFDCTATDLHRTLDELHSSNPKGLSYLLAPPEPNICLETYNYVYQRNEPALGPYFRILKCILAQIDASPRQQRQRYVSILLAQLTNSELWLILLHTSMPATKWITHAIKHHNLLKNCPDYTMGVERIRLVLAIATKN